MTEIEQGKWSEEVAALLAPAMEADPLATVETVRACVDEGRQRLFVVREGGEITGAFTLGIEDAEAGREMIVPVAGSKSGRALSRQVVPFIEAEAIEAGCAFVRAHVPQARWAKVLRRYGFGPAEIVMRKEVENGRA